MREKERKASFVAGTPVKTSDGEKPIEKVSQGDLVLSRSPDTGEEEYRPVTQTLQRETRQLYRIRYSDGSVIQSTRFHPFFVEEGKQVEAEELERGMSSLLSEEKESLLGKLRIETVEELQLKEPVAVYNMEVEEFHTYFVGQHQVWVHNQPRGPGRPSPRVVRPRVRPRRAPRPGKGDRNRNSRYEQIQARLVRQQYEDFSRRVQGLNQRLVPGSYLNANKNPPGTNALQGLMGLFKDLTKSAKELPRDMVQKKLELAYENLEQVEAEMIGYEPCGGRDECGLFAQLWRYYVERPIQEIRWYSRKRYLDGRVGDYMEFITKSKDYNLDSVKKDLERELLDPPQSIGDPSFPPPAPLQALEAHYIYSKVVWSLWKEIERLQKQEPAQQ